MAKNKTVIEGSSNVSAPQLKDFFRQIDEKLITGTMIQDILEKRNPFSRNWRTWKTIEIGRYTFSSEICSRLKDKGFTVDTAAASHILEHLYISTNNPEKINLALVDMEDLGFSEDDYTGLIPYADVLKRALKLGLTYCLPEDAPALREQYSDQPLMDYIRVGMIPVVCPNFHMGKSIFVLNGKNIHCAGAGLSDTGVAFGSTKFVFRIAK